VLGQASTVEHVRVHVQMLLWAVRHRIPREALGQVLRIVGAATKTALGWVPMGNTGGSHVSPFRPVPIRPFLRTNHVDAALDACLRGLGCAQFLSYQVEAQVKAGTLLRVLADFEPLPVPIHLVYPHARLLSPNVRALLDLAVTYYRGRR